MGGKKGYSLQLTASKIGNHTRLIGALFVRSGDYNLTDTHNEGLRTTFIQCLQLQDHFRMFPRVPRGHSSVMAGSKITCTRKVFQKVAIDLVTSDRDFYRW